MYREGQLVLYRLGGDHLYCGQISCDAGESNGMTLWIVEDIRDHHMHLLTELSVYELSPLHRVLYEIQSGR